MQAMLRNILLRTRTPFKRTISTTSHLQRHYPTDFKAANLGKNLSKYDVLAMSTVPENNVEMISHDSIIFSNMKVIKSPNKLNQPIGCLLLANQIFEWNLKDIRITNDLIVDFQNIQLNKLLDAIYPKPELLVVGLGKKTRMLSENTREMFTSLGIKVEISDTKSSVRNYDLLATERSTVQVAAFILPPNL